MKRKIAFIAGGIAALTLVALAAFMAMRLLGAKIPAGPGLVEAVGGAPGRSDGDKGAGGITITFDPAPELPKRQAEIIGEVTEVKDNSVFVLPASKLQQNIGAPQEVVIVKQTQIYRDTSMENQPPPTESTHMQQTVAPVEMSQIAASQVVEVWGEKRGERLIAEAIVTHGPAVIIR